MLRILLKIKDKHVVILNVIFIFKNNKHLWLESTVENVLVDDFQFMELPELRARPTNVKILEKTTER